MVLPLSVDDLQHDVALDPVKDRRIREQGLLLLVLLQRDLPDRVRHLVRRHGAEVERLLFCRIEAENLRHGLGQRIEIPRFGIRVAGCISRDRVRCQILGEREQVPANVERVLFGISDLSFEQLPAQRVDALALLVHHVVVFQEVFADGEVLSLDLLLRALDGAGHHLVLDRHALFHAEPLHQA